jgi:Glucoamylase and related glycosyl hydrolases
MDNLDYGVVGNCKTAALISKEGSIDWLCFPVFDSPSVFSKLLDNDKGGSFSFIVSDSYRITQNYFKETNILCTRFASDEGVFEVLDFYAEIQDPWKTSIIIPSEIYRYIRLIDGKTTF